MTAYMLVQEVITDEARCGAYRDAVIKLTMMVA